MPAAFGSTNPDAVAKDFVVMTRERDSSFMQQTGEKGTDDEGWTLILPTVIAEDGGVQSFDITSAMMQRPGVDNQSDWTVLMPVTLNEADFAFLKT